MRLAGITTSLIDWPGHVSVVMFFSGCNFRCGYCHNHQLISRQHGRDYHHNEVHDLIKNYASIADAVVMCGGEPTLQPFQLYAECLPIINKFGLRSKLDTNGSRSSVVLKCLQNGLDKVSLDVKARPNEAVYDMVIGRCDNNAHPIVDIMRTMKYVKKYNKELEVRTTIVPGLNDSHDDVGSIVSFVKDYATEYTLQKYDNSNVYHPLFKNVRGPTDAQMETLANIAREHISKVTVK